jgi:hypothetical protein
MWYDECVNLDGGLEMTETGAMVVAYLRGLAAHVEAGAVEPLSDLGEFIIMAAIADVKQEQET